MLWVYPFWHTYGLIHETLPMAALVALKVVLTGCALLGQLRVAEIVPLESPSSLLFAPGAADLYAATTFSRRVLRLRWDPATSAAPQFVAAIAPDIGARTGGPLRVMVPVDNAIVLVGRIGAPIVQRFVRDANSGQLTQQTPEGNPALIESFQRDARPASASPDGNHVYVASEQDQALIVYSRNSLDGSLVPVETIDVRPQVERDFFGARTLAMSPDGSRLICVSQFGSPLTLFDRAADGALAPVATFGESGAHPTGLDGARAAVFSPDGRRIYIASQFASTLMVIEFDADRDGLRDLDEGDTDVDADAIPNSRDEDSDNNGISDEAEPGGDLDNDGVADFLDLDDEGDTRPDAAEGTADADDDGVPNHRDMDSDGNRVPDQDDGTGDFDTDGTPDFLDIDDDNDRISGSVEGAGDLDGDGAPNYRDADADGDGIGDLAEGAWDTDGDGVIDSLDPAELPAAASVYLSQDADADGIPNGDEGYDDADKDGVPEYLDNDSDGNRVEDRIEGTSDPDADGIPDYRDRDDDGDGIRDEAETEADTDGDGIPNRLDDDSDANGVGDSIEGAGDRNADEEPDYLDLDNDGDGVQDILQPAGIAPGIATRGVLAIVQTIEDGVAGVDGLEGAIDLCLSPSGHRVYVAGYEANSVAIFDRHPDTGAVSFSGALRDGENNAMGLRGPRALLLSPLGDFLYVASREQNAIAVFRVDIAK